MNVFGHGDFSFSGKVVVVEIGSVDSDEVPLRRGIGEACMCKTYRTKHAEQKRAVSTRSKRLRSASVDVVCNGDTSLCGAMT